jgi:hypothetical protein
MDNTRLPKHALNYQPGGRRDLGCPTIDGNASMPEQVKRPNEWMVMMMIMIFVPLLCKAISRVFGILKYFFSYKN